MDPLTLSAAACIFLIAGTVKGVVGIGLPTVTLGLATLFLDPRTAIALLLMPMFVSNVWQAFRLGGIGPALRRYWLFGLMMVIFIYLATGYAAAASEAILMVLTGGAFVIFSLVSLALKPPPLPERWDKPAQVVGGIAAGLLGGLTAIWAPPIAIYLSAKQVHRDEFVRATGLLFTLGALPLMAGYARAGLFTGPQAALSAAMVLPVLAGFTLGEWLRRRIPGERFRRLILWVFLGLGLNLIRRGIVMGAW